MQIPNKGYCVYSHARPDGVVFYVGCGHPRRALEWAKRSEAWLRVMHDCDCFELQFHFWTNSKAEAHAFERRLVAELQPIANMRGTKRSDVVARNAARRGKRAPYVHSDRYWVGKFP
jgi:hypothetical protein